MDKTQQERYARQISLPEIGAGGQEKLLAGKVLLVGAGGLGSPVSMYLAAAGVGTLGVIDHDEVDLSNLQRQIVHGTADIGKPKVISARETLAALNPDCRVVCMTEALTDQNAAKIISDYDFVVDATDNFTGKFLIADTCKLTSTPYSHAGILAFTGQTITVIPGETACYRCIFEEPAPDYGPPRGPLGAVAGVIGCLQAAEAIKYLVDCGDLLTDRILTYDALAASFRTVKVHRNPDCILCGKTQA